LNFENGFLKIGQWTIENGINYSKIFDSIVEKPENILNVLTY
jgi:hypothetical protein